MKPVPAPAAPVPDQSTVIIGGVSREALEANWADFCIGIEPVEVPGPEWMSADRYAALYKVAQGTAAKRLQTGEERGELLSKFKRVKRADGKIYRVKYYKKKRAVIEDAVRSAAS